MPIPPPGPKLHLSADRALQLIPDTKVIPPRGARQLMPRAVLMSRLMEARRQRCVAIQGPAGSGKTSTLLAWRRELVAIDFDVAWLSLTGEDNEPARLANCLLASVAEVDSAITREATQLLGEEGGELALEHWIIVLLQNIAQHGNDLVLMIDDLHHLNDPDLFNVLGWLLDYAPTNLHLVFGTRSALPSALPLARLRTQGQLSEFDLRDLRFSAEESAQYLRQQFGQISQHDAEVLHDLTDGWVAGLQLFAIDLKSKHGSGFNRMQVRGAGAFAQYFEQEVLQHLPAADLQLLTCASLCNRFTAPLCARLVGKPHAIAGMMSQLTRLDSENLFITQIKSHDRETWYRLHPLLREVLRDHLSRQSQEQQSKLHAIARDWLFEQGYIDEAVRHAVLAGDFQIAADIVEACAHELMARGSLSQLPNLLRKLPMEQMRERYSLQLVMAQLQLHAHNFAEGQQILDHLEAQQHRLSAVQRQGLLVTRGTLAMQRDQTEAAWSLAPELEAIPDDADDLILTGRASILAWLYLFSGDHSRVRAIIQHSDRPNTSPRRTLIGRCIYGVSLVHEGRISEAENIFRNTLEEAKPHGNSAAVAGHAAAAFLASLLYEQSNLAEVCQLLEPRLDILERISLPNIVLHSLLALSRAYWLKGESSQALAYLERLKDYAQRYDLGRLLAWVLYVRMRWHLEKFQSSQAEVQLAALKALADKNAGIQRGTPLIIHLLAMRAAVELSLYQREFNQAIEQITALINLCESARHWQLATIARLQLSIAEAGRGHDEQAQQQLTEVLRQGHRLGLVRSLLDVAPQLPLLLSQLLQANVLGPVLAFYAQRLITATRPTVNPERKAASPLASLSERETEVLQLMAQAMTNKKIARTLGVSPETVKWHIKNLFAKLGVAGRVEAIAKWRDLHIS
ncbi:LuxR C-terminal-related transcriptional regulator [Pseudomonas tussilaginis]|uniref:LuxR C-terminal-related transcriptional regulator n=1 Tax=unclassified Pseudomonas TaxID=196821 RepID=UPI000C6CD11D|nr:MULTISPECIES: LuxR C-terminal-related transcriptional regulator [unclassified Pseudomonas]QYX48722.1 LuxR C-terminal-related transcriptional regulator [Pseudomonas sp. S11A 273]